VGIVSQGKKLIVCAGERLKPGFMTHDVQDLPSIDIKCELWDLPKYVTSSSFDEIHFTHALEHFPMKDSIRVLRLLWSLLEDGGKLYIEVPNYKWHAEMILEDPFNRQIVEYSFGGQLNEWDYHYNGYTPEILDEDLVDAGFIVNELKPNSSIECWATAFKKAPDED
jgi:hypothetical protein